MKAVEEIGKWFLDIAKYVATACILSSFLGEIGNGWIMYVVSFVTVFCCMAIGVYLLNKKKRKGKEE